MDSIEKIHWKLFKWQQTWIMGEMSLKQINQSKMKFWAKNYVNR